MTNRIGFSTVRSTPAIRASSSNTQLDCRHRRVAGVEPVCIASLRGQNNREKRLKGLETQNTPEATLRRNKRPDSLRSDVFPQQGPNASCCLLRRRSPRASSAKQIDSETFGIRQRSCATEQLEGGLGRRGVRAAEGRSRRYLNRAASVLAQRSRAILKACQASDASKPYFVQFYRQYFVPVAYCSPHQIP